MKEGFAKCVDWTMKVVMEGRERLRAAEKEAKEKKKRIWKVGCVSPPLSLSLWGVHSHVQ